MKNDIGDLVEMLAAVLLNKGMKIAVAESCTGGGICQALTDIPGSSVWFDRGFVTYSNEAKQDLLGVDSDQLKLFGAVSRQVALEMAAGALHNSQADLTVAVTGIAGPGGGSEEKPVGTVFIAWQRKNGRTSCQQYHFSGDRAAVRHQTIKAALQGCLEQLKG